VLLCTIAEPMEEQLSAASFSCAVSKRCYVRCQKVELPHMPKRKRMLSVAIAGHDAALRPPLCKPRANLSIPRSETSLIRVKWVRVRRTKKKEQSKYDAY
jgi:hypothetical protein